MESETKITDWNVGDKVSLIKYINTNQKKKSLDFRHGIIVEKCKNNFFRVSIKTISENYNECFFKEDLLTEEQENLIKMEARPMKKNKLEDLSDVVEKILRKEELARRDDCYLILRVIECLYPQESGKTFATVMLNAKEKEISFESITRARRKVQGEFPELKDKDTSDLRNTEQKEYRAYARE